MFMKAENKTGSSVHHNQSEKEEGGFWKNINKKVGYEPDGNGFNLIKKLKDFTTEAVRLVAEIDEGLSDNNSPYEVGDFRVKGSISVVGGMDLDIHFVKTPSARDISNEKNKMLKITNPRTGKQISVPRISLAGKSIAKVKDPDTGEILTIDVKKGQVVN